jgi:hypothetical protein
MSSAGIAVQFDRRLFCRRSQHPWVPALLLGASMVARQVLAKEMKMPYGSAAGITPAPTSIHSRTPLNRQQIVGFWAAWFGWMLDGMDSVIYALVLGPALTELLPRSSIEATPANIGYAGSLMFGLFLVGWGGASTKFTWVLLNHARPLNIAEHAEVLTDGDQGGALVWEARW